MAKSKLGLQKEVSKIFTGIQIPEKNAAGPDARSTAPASPITPHAQVAPAVTPASYAPVTQSSCIQFLCDSCEDRNSETGSCITQTIHYPGTPNTSNVATDKAGCL